MDGLNKKLEATKPLPVPALDKRIKVKIQDKPKNFITGKTRREKEVVGGKKNKFADEYSFSGWFKWN